MLFRLLKEPITQDTVNPFNVCIECSGDLYINLYIKMKRTLTVRPERKASRPLYSLFW